MLLLLRFSAFTLYFTFLTSLHQQCEPRLIDQIWHVFFRKKSPCSPWRFPYRSRGNPKSTLSFKWSIPLNIITCTAPPRLSLRCFQLLHFCMVDFCVLCDQDMMIMKNLSTLHQLKVNDDHKRLLSRCKEMLLHDYTFVRGLQPTDVNQITWVWWWLPLRQVVKTSVNVRLNSPSRDYNHPDNCTSLYSWYNLWVQTIYNVTPTNIQVTNSFKFLIWIIAT